MVSNTSDRPIDKTAGFGDLAMHRHEHSHVRPGVATQYLKLSERDQQKPPLASLLPDAAPLRQRFILKEK